MPKASLKKALMVGLRRSYRAGRNEPGLRQLVNATVNESGIYPYEPVSTQISISAAAGIPAVAVFRGPTYIVAIANNDKVYTLADDDVDWAETEITSSIVSPGATGVSPTFDAGLNQWQFAGFQRGWLATNGSCMLISVNDEGVYLDTDSHPLCVCLFRGRVFYGGMARHWTRFNAQGFAADMFGQDLEAMTDAWVGWCTIQGIDILQHVWPERAVSHGTGRVEDTLPGNGYLLAGSTDWSGFGSGGWAYLTGPNRFEATYPAGGVLEYLVDVSTFSDVTTFRLEIDLVRTNGSVDVDVYFAAPGIDIEYVGNLTLNTTGLHVIYFQLSAPGGDFSIRLDASSFGGICYGVGLKQAAEFNKFTTWKRHALLGQSGFSPASDQGKVLCIKALHDHVVVYGSNFITAYSPVSVPSPTFGKVSIASFGVAGRLAVGGDLNIHLLCDSSGKLWTIDNQLSLKLVGYEEYFQLAMAAGGASDLAIGYDDNESKFYISFTDAVYTSGVTYVWNGGGGLSCVETEVIHSVCGTRDTATWAETTAYATDGVGDRFELTTDTFDFEEPGIKTIHSVEVIGEGVETLTVTIWAHIAANGFFVCGDHMPCNNTGQVFPEQSGEAFMLQLDGDDYTVVRIYDIQVTYDVGGKLNAKSVMMRR